MPRFKVIFEITYTTDADTYEEAIEKAYDDLPNWKPHVCDVKELSYSEKS